MEIFTVSFFGHRELHSLSRYEDILEKHIRDLIQAKEYVDFLVGRDGDFDRLVSSTIIRCADKYGYGNTHHILVLPYMRAEYRDNMDSFLNYYDDVEICSSSSDAHYKSAITIRNRDMVDRSDFVIFCAEHEGGAYRTMKYAEKQKKPYINIAGL